MSELVHLPAESLAHHLGWLTSRHGFLDGLFQWRTHDNRCVTACSWERLEKAHKQKPALWVDRETYDSPSRVAFLMVAHVTCPHCKVLFDAVSEMRP